MSIEAPSIGIHNLVDRQTPDSASTHWTFDDGSLLELIQTHFHEAKPGYRDGVLLVPVNPEEFYSPVVQLRDGDVLTGDFKPRTEDEAPRKHLRVIREEGKAPAAAVDVVLYRSDVLAEGGERCTECDWEVVSVNARTTLDPQPMPPMTLMANHFEADGGTATGMSPEAFESALRESFRYWQDKAFLAP